MGMQQDADTVDYPVIQDGYSNTCAPAPTGPGGNYTLVNQDEAEIIEASYEFMEVRQAGQAENLSTVNPLFREQAL